MDSLGYYYNLKNDFLPILETENMTQNFESSVRFDQ